MEKARALAVAVGTGYAYETTFEKEVYSDLYGERGVLMGGIRALGPVFRPRMSRC
jgi:ketol-acid reductoisomerase